LRRAGRDCPARIIAVRFLFVGRGVVEQSNFASSFLDCPICAPEHLSSIAIVIADPAAAAD
jgi:hypothetical protein